MHLRKFVMPTLIVLSTFLTSIYGTTSCGNNMCLCRNDKAICRGYGKKLGYIPELPNRITDLTFRNNYLPFVNSQTFKNISHLKISNLRIENCGIINVSNDAFSSLLSIRLIDLDQNSKINKIQLSQSFRSIQRTKPMTLILSHLDLSDISVDFFKHLYNSQIVKISIANNALTVLDMTVFQQLTTLTDLQAGNNRIRRIDNFNGHRNLTNLDLSGNELVRKIPMFCSPNSSESFYPNLQSLDLSKNFISELTSTSFKCLRGLESIKLQENMIKIIKANTFSYLPRLKKLYMFFMNGNIKKIEPYAFNNSNLAILNIHDNGIQLKFSNDIFKGCSGLQTLIFSGNSFQGVRPDHFIRMFMPLHSLTSLSAVDCNMKIIPKQFLDVLPNLRSLTLDKNHILSLNNLLNCPSNLTHLNIQSNNIRVLTRHDFPTNLSASKKMTLNLVMNPLECTCDMLWFRTTIGDKDKIGNIKLSNLHAYTCATPALLKDSLFIDYNPTESVCKNILLIIVTSSSCLFLCVMISMILAYKYRWYISYWIYKPKIKKRKKNPEKQPLLSADNQIYNGYVIYNSDESHFVDHDFRGLVEQSMGYKLKIWMRDAGLGGFKLEEMVDSIYNCETVLAVISKSSLNDPWVQFQINVALDRQVELKRPLLILILLENVNYQKMSKYWCVMLTKQIAAYWCADQDNIRRRVFEEQVSKFIDNGHLQNVC